MTEAGSNAPEPTPSPAATPAPDTPAAASAVAYTGPAPTAEEKQLGMFTHLLGILGFIGPLVIWLIKKDTSPFINDQGKEALNFHLMLLIGYVIGGATSFFCIGLLIIPAVWIVGTIFAIMGGLKAKEGIAYRYPFTIRFIK